MGRGVMGCNDCSLLWALEPLPWAVLGTALQYHSVGVFTATGQPGLWGQQVRVSWGCLCWYGLTSPWCCQLPCGPKEDFWFWPEAVGGSFFAPMHLLIARGYVRNVAIHV